MTRMSSADGSVTARPRGTPAVAVVMGSDSDLNCMQAAVDTLEQFDVTHEVRVLSAHRRPDEMLAYGAAAADRGIGVIIAGAGGAAHLPGMLAGATRLPVIGVPVPLRHLDGLDSLLSIVQMPRGVPVATVAIGNAQNAALLACRMLALADPRLADAMDSYRDEIRARSADADDAVRGRLGSTRGATP